MKSANKRLKRQVTKLQQIQNSKLNNIENLPTVDIDANAIIYSSIHNETCEDAILVYKTAGHLVMIPFLLALSIERYLYIDRISMIDIVMFFICVIIIVNAYMHTLKIYRKSVTKK